MSIWIAKTVNKEEQYVKLVCHVQLRVYLGMDQEEFVTTKGVMVETMQGERIVHPEELFYQRHDRTEHVDFMEAYYGQ